jgi:hypothetical protein
VGQYGCENQSLRFVVIQKPARSDKRLPRTLRAVAFVACGLSVSVWPVETRAVSDPVEVTTCGQRIQGAAYISGDLDCSGFSGLYGIILEAGRPRGELDLRGFTVTGPPMTPGAAIRCEGNCDVFGGGSVTGGAWGIQGVGRVRVYDTLVFNTGRNGIDGGPATRLFNVVITGSGKEAVWGWRQVIRNSTITGNGNGSVPPSPTVHGDRVAVFDSIITGNEGIGVEGVSVRVRDSNVSGNGTSPVCGVTYNCIFDIGSYRRPRVRDTTCDRSLDSRACGECNGEQPLQEINDARIHNWGVCTLD